MIIAQITDLHVVDRDTLLNGFVRSNAQLAEAVAHINQLNPVPDVVFASGDLTENGSESEYEMLLEIVSDLVPPLFVIPGNHDDRDTLLEVFSSRHPYLPRPGAAFAHYTIDEYPVRLIGLDTNVPGQPHGMMCEDRLLWLDEQLNLDRQKPTMIFMHHPPFRTGVHWMDAAGLHGGRAMEEIVSRHRQVVRVACGHIHRPIHVAWGGTIASSAPSTCYQVSLVLGDQEGFEIAMEPRTVQLHVQDPGYGLVTHLSYVSKEFEQIRIMNGMRAKARAKLLGTVQHSYDELCRKEFDRAL
jgi:3',5'-cyclic AMP phosphodiesterase CpdA